MDALKVNVFNFGMFYSEIISGIKYFGGVYFYSAYQETIERDKRPNLPKSYSKELKLLIENC